MHADPDDVTIEPKRTRFDEAWDYIVPIGALLFVAWVAAIVWSRVFFPIQAIREGSGWLADLTRWLAGV